MHFSISRVMTSISITIVITIGIQAAISYASLTYLHDAVAEIAENRVPSFIHLGQLNTDLSDSRIAQSDYLSAAADKRSAFDEGLKSAFQAIDDDIRLYEPYLVDQADKDYLAAFKKKFAAASADWAEVKKLVDAGKVDEAKLEKVLGEVMDLTPRGIRTHLQLNKPIYAKSAAYGHFGRKAGRDGSFSWEKTDLVDALKKAVAA